MLLCLMIILVGASLFLLPSLVNGRRRTRVFFASADSNDAGRKEKIKEDSSLESRMSMKTNQKGNSAHTDGGREKRNEKRTIKMMDHFVILCPIFCRLCFFGPTAFLLHSLFDSYFFPFLYFFDCTFFALSLICDM